MTGPVELLQDLWLLRAYWLAGLPVLLLLFLWQRHERGGLAGWNGVIDETLMPVLTRLGHVAYPQSRLGHLAPLTAAAALCLALSGPARQNDDAPSFQNLDGIMLLMDMSPSVAQGGNLDDAQAAAAYLLQRVGARPVGLILYTGDPFLVSAMTIDTATLEGPIAVLDAGIMPSVGSRPERALGMARGFFHEAGILSGDVVLITDGGGMNTAALQETIDIAKAGGRVSTIFVPPLPEVAEANPEMPPPDWKAMEQLADAGGGLAIGMKELSDLSDMLRNSRTENLARSELAPLLFDDLGRYLVILAMIPALFLFRRGR